MFQVTAQSELRLMKTTMDNNINIKGMILKRKQQQGDGSDDNTALIHIRSNFNLSTTLSVLSKKISNHI